LPQALKRVVLKAGEQGIHGAPLGVNRGAGTARRQGEKVCGARIFEGWCIASVSIPDGSVDSRLRWTKSIKMNDRRAPSTCTSAKLPRTR
jgi:hypothetical protein